MARVSAFLTSHAKVLLALAGTPEARVVDLAEAARITERTTYRILADLQKTGYVSHQRAGRDNRYRVNLDLPLADGH
jgi:DNA-binding IclR family transcriptional regulator